jgi:hypothetical protein
VYVASTYVYVGTGSTAATVSRKGAIVCTQE